MVSSNVWKAAAVTAVALAAVPLGHRAWQEYAARKDRRDTIKLLHKVELIVAEVAVRLNHLESQAEDFVANEDKEDNNVKEAAPDSTLNSYYHFDSQGNKLKTKWNNYDVDAELERLEKEEQGEEVPAPAPVKAKPAPRKAPQMDKKKLLAVAAGIEHEFEAVLEFLDDIRGDDQVKQLRKALASKINKEHFARVDSIRKLLA